MRMDSIFRLIAYLLSNTPLLNAYISFQENTNIISANTPLALLTTISKASEVKFVFKVDLTLMNASQSIIHNRKMLFMLACDEYAYQFILSTGWQPNGTDPKLNSQICYALEIPSESSVLHNICEAYPLQQISPPNEFENAPSLNGNSYRTQTSIEGSFNASKEQTMYVFIDACETVGGVEGVLPSCFGAHLPPCFDCAPMQRSTSKYCEMSPSIKPEIQGYYSISACGTDGSCTGDDYKQLKTFYPIQAGLSCAVLILGWFYAMNAKNEYMQDLIFPVIMLLMLEVS